jgi:hypothetical protein
MLVTQEGESPIGGMSGKPTIERDMDMVEAGETSSAAGEMLGKTTRLFFIIGSKQREQNMNGKRLKGIYRNEQAHQETGEVE